MIESIVATTLKTCVKELYNIDIEAHPHLITRTKREFSGDFTIVVFPFVKAAGKPPETVAAEIGAWIQKNLPDSADPLIIKTVFLSFNIIKGFLNFTVESPYWIHFLESHKFDLQFGFSKNIDNETVMVEYSSPNTNKPLHLGHIRNNLLGDSITRILKACGKKTIKVNLVNDRGIHICKSMLAWLRFGNNETPESSGLKGDHLVGKYYVEFDKRLKEECAQLTLSEENGDENNKIAPLMREAQEMLRQWENGNEEIRALWKTMNSWVYQGFAQTYQRLGVDFDHIYYESETYLLGKKLVEEGLQQGVFYQKDDHSVWVDLTEEGLDEKAVLRSDGTSVYITQDLGTAQLRYEEYHPHKMIYVVGNEQDYHFNVLKLILSKLQKPFGKSIEHLSYGMVELPAGKMKSREGTVVDADDLMTEMFNEAKRSTEELGKNDISGDEAFRLYEMIGMGALKYFILKVDPQKNMLFNPNESIDFNGNTAPFIQYTHARIRSVLRKAEEAHIDFMKMVAENTPLDAQETHLLHSVYEFPQTVALAGKALNPGLIANYIFELSKDFNRFYQETPIFKETDAHKQILRLQIARLIGITITNGMSLLGIEVPERM